MLVAVKAQVHYVIEGFRFKLWGCLTDFTPGALVSPGPNTLRTASDACLILGDAQHDDLQSAVAQASRLGYRGEGLIGLILRVFVPAWLSNAMLPVSRRQLRHLLFVFLTHPDLIGEHEPFCDEKWGNGKASFVKSWFAFHM